MLSAKQGNYGYHFYNVDAVFDWGLNPGPPALDGSTLALGYRGDVVVWDVSAILRSTSYVNGFNNVIAN